MAAEAGDGAAAAAVGSEESCHREGATRRWRSRSSWLLRRYAPRNDGYFHSSASSTAIVPPERRLAGSLALLYLPSLLLAAGALVLALHERPRLPAYRQKIFQLLFARNEPDGALLLLALVLLAPAVARLLSTKWTVLPARLASKRAVIAIAIGAVLALAAGAQVVYRARPLAMDEYAPSFQARVFAAGELRARVPPDLLPRLVPPRLLFPFFATDARSGTIVSTYWPGFALLLTPFTWLGAPWLLNPLLGGAALLLLATLARRWTGEPAAAGWALLFALASPAFTVNAVSFYPLTAHLALNLLWMMLLVDRATASGLAAGSPLWLTSRPRRLLAAGAVGSLALVLHNPVPHAVFALPWLPALLRRGGWRATAWLALGYLPLASLLGVGWLPVRQAMSGADGPASAGTGGALGQAAEMASRAFVLPDAALLYARLLALAELLTWAAPFLPVLACLGWRATRRGSPLRLLALSALATLLVYLFVPFDQGHGWGYRYFHSAWSALPLLAAAVLVAPCARRWRAPVLAAALLAIPAANTLRAAQVGSFIAAHRARLPPLPAKGRYVCFLSLAGGAHRVDLLQNDPFLRDPVILLASAGFSSDAALVARHFPQAALVSRRSDASIWRLGD
jgi:hypothetical protein